MKELKHELYIWESGELKGKKRIGYRLYNLKT